VKLLAKEKSLLNKTSTKSKKQNKYSETGKSIKTDYIHNLRENLIYKGSLYEDKNGLKCFIVSRSRTKNGKQYYKIQFEDGLTVETISDTLEKIKEKEEDINENN
jgi:inner membrane protein involved in colicin E2 resistance